MDELQRRLVRRIRDLAKRRGVRVTHLPDRAGVSRTHFWDVLAGRASPTLQWLERVAAALEADVADLVGRGDRQR